MRKYVLVTSSLMIVLTVWELIYAYMPKTGPIGDGPNMARVWLQSSASFIGGIGFLSLAIYQIVKEKKTK
ncbi:hypothetical protein [Brevibacillus sp. NRS-1366]|uniref:hypothetical protein n=1 Tax=Brevibacillus sp. NRS-1366 TaxID=3233899 RepID=UPI003D20147D